VKPFRKIFTELFGFDRRERRGTYMLALILLVLLLVRVFSLRPDVEHLNYESAAPSRPADQAAMQTESGSAALFTFDPNTASLNDLLNLGLTERQAKTLINYRSSGAHFHRPQDLIKVYGIDSVTSARLIPWIRIAEDKVYERTVRKASTRDSTRKPGTAVPDAAPVELIDLNRCDASDLLRLPGIGPVLSERIIRYRGLLGGFVDTGQLYEVYGLDSSVVILISSMLTLTYDSVSPVILGSSSFSELARHPYIGSSTARLITKYRSLIDTTVTLGDLVRQKVMSAEQAMRLAPYVRPSPEAEGDEYEFILSKVLK